MSVFLYILSANIDAFGVGISYGVRKIGISRGALVVVELISLLCATIALVAGFLLGDLMSKEVGVFFAEGVLLLMGIWTLFTALKKDVKIKERSFFIRSLGITISIIRDPSKCDFDKSQQIDKKEAVFLTLALSLDSIVIGISLGLMGLFRWYLPFIVGTAQFLFLVTGMIIGRTLTVTKIPEKTWSVLAGISLILLALIG